MSTQPNPELDNLQEFNGQALKLVSPFRVVKHFEISKMAKTGRPYTSHVVIGAPVANPSVKFKTTMFKAGYDMIRAILFLNQNSAIQAEVVVGANNRTNTIFSGVLPPS